MALKFFVKDLSEVPEAFRSEYKQVQGGFQLDAEGVVSESEVGGLKQKNKELLDEKKNLLAQYNELLETKNLTDKQREELEAKVADLEKQTMTADEIAARKIKQAQEQEAAKTRAALDKAGEFEKLYASSTIENAIRQAAAASGAHDASQVFGMLSWRSKLEPVTGDDGKPTGQYRPVTTVEIEEGGKRVARELPTNEAVAAFLGLPENKNLINPTAKPGGGSPHHGGSGGAKTVTRAAFDAMDLAARMEFATKGGSVVD